MGFFKNNKKLCPICDQPTPRLFPTKVEDTPICKDCAGKIFLPKGTLDRMNLTTFAKYLDFYDDNAALRQQFSCDYEFDVDGWSDELNLDMAHRLFRLNDLEGGIVFPGSCLQSFAILEDGEPIFEGDASGLKCTDSQVPAKIRALEPMMNNYLAERREYERLKNLYELMDRDDDDDRRSSRMREPQFDPPMPVSKFQVQLTMDHPYWPTFEGALDGPSFSFSEPSLYDYQEQYQKKAAQLEQLAKNLMKFLNPTAPVRRAGETAPVASTAAPTTDVVKQLKEYKELMDMGILTPEEFAAKKKQLLGI